MTFGEVMTYIMLFFAIIGCVDKAFGCKFKIGNGFEKALMTSGTLMLAMVGPMALAPLLSTYLAPVLAPVCSVVGIDPSITAGMILPIDAGGWSLAKSIAADVSVGKFSGVIVGSMMGATITGSLPVCFLLCPKDKIHLMAKGLAIGFISIPVGSFVGGIFMGLNILSLIVNMIPLVIMAGILSLGLILFEKITVKLVTGFGYLITALVTLALGVTMVMKVFNIKSDTIESFDNCLVIIGNIVIFLCGAFVLLNIIQILFKKPLEKIGKKIGLDEFSVIGIITIAVNIIPTFSFIDKMKERGFIICSAFMVCGAFLIGDHLAFQTTVDTTLALPMVIGKLAGGIFAAILAFIITKSLKEN